MLDTSNDTVLGLLALGVFIPAVILLGYLIYRFKNARLMRAWQPLLGLFEQARISGDGGGAAASWLSGRHGGRAFRATMYPGVAVDQSSEGGGPRFNLFELVLLEVPGAVDWCVKLHEGRSREAASSWSLEADAPGTAAALQAAGVVDAVAARVVADYTLARNGPVLAFRRKSAELVLRADAREGFAPPAEWVQEALGLLLRVAEINARVNAPGIRSGK